MGANTAVEMATKVTVVTENSDNLGPMSSTKPAIEMVSSPAEFVFAPVLGAIIVWVVDTQKRFISKTAALTLSAIGLKSLVAHPSPMPKNNGFPFVWMLFIPAFGVLVGVLDEFFPVSKIVAPIVLALLLPLFVRQRLHT